uniref:Uncharacterized protein n=1 Tax=Phakopsora pachyrhizi TaxID=170000 RepID=A0A0S1MIM7_PHAPC
MMGSAFFQISLGFGSGFVESFFFCDKQQSLRRDWVDIVMGLSGYVH